MGPYGRVDLTYVTGFQSQQLTTSVRVDRIDGTHMGAELPKGWEGQFDLERGSSDAEDFIAKLESAYYAGTMPASGTMYQYITESDGSTSTYQFDGVVFRLSQAGTWRGDASVKQAMTFFAATRTRL